VQPQNLKLFQRMSWTSLAEVDLHGRPHHLMQVDLGCYTPYFVPQTRLVLSAPPKLAA
jgi:hypothetical protein